MTKEKKRIIVLEDEKALLKIIKTKLSKRGYQVDGVRSVEEARELVEGGRGYDLIWVDHYLLGAETGLDFVHHLKEKKSDDVPIFIISNTCSADKYREYLDLGIDKYFVKSDNELEKIIENIDLVLNA